MQLKHRCSALSEETPTPVSMAVEVPSGDIQSRLMRNLRLRSADGRLTRLVFVTVFALVIYSFSESCLRPTLNFLPHLDVSELEQENVDVRRMFHAAYGRMKFVESDSDHGCGQSRCRARTNATVAESGEKQGYDIDSR
jgi:hypothetical protein